MTRGPSLRSSRCRKPSACRRGRRAVRRKILRLTAPAAAPRRTSRASGDRFRTSGSGVSVPSSRVGKAAPRFFPPVAFRSPSPRNDRTSPTNRGTGRTRDTTCFGAVARASVTPLRGARREAGRRITATARRTKTAGSRAAETARGVRAAPAGGLGTRASLFSRSQRAVDVRASAITRAVATTNPMMISVNDNTTTHPRYGRGRSGSRSSAATSRRSRQPDGPSRRSAPDVLNRYGASA